MKPSFRQGQHIPALCAGAFLAGAILSMPASADTTEPNASTRYRNDVQACQSGQSSQDRDTCLKEARNALAASKSGALATDTNALQQSRMQRCQVHTGEDRVACIARMAGRGSTSGDVASGGILREVETVVLPPGTGAVVIEPKTSDTVIVVPEQR